MSHDLLPAGNQRSPTSRRGFLGTLGSLAAVGLIPSGRIFGDEVNDLLNQQLDASIRRALWWLASEQQASGAWTTSDFGESTATTALAIMSFLAGGHVPEEGPYGRHLTRGVGWLLSQQHANGLLVGTERSHGPMYSHGIATLMLAEVAGMVDPSQEEKCRDALQKAVKLIIDAQNYRKPAEHDGGWRYQPTSGDSDLSVTAWQLLALRAAKDIGCDVPAENIDRAIAYIRRLHVKHDGGFGYMVGHGSSITRSGTGIVALEVCGEHRTTETLAAANLILSRPLTKGEQYFYYGAYYCTVGMFKVGGEEWRQSREVLYRTIMDLQNPTGYWNPEDGTERQAGRVYSTSLAVLALAIEYGFLPIYQR
ncbi:MAG TPA: terpene cyclase/mutase family protein [Planctomycetaceae bacterium]|nr:terpene cyclase/mutase family protein [Planctomycetaceae bacterium]